MGKVLITGSCGFIASNFVRYLDYEGYCPEDLVLLDSKDYSSDDDILKNGTYPFIHCSVGDKEAVHKVFKEYGPFEYVINWAARSHVDRSLIDGVDSLYKTNLHGVINLLEECKEYKPRAILQISTDECLGNGDPRSPFTESAPLSPRNPYSSSKACAEMVCNSYFHTYGVPVVITRGANTFGKYQYPEKLIPLNVTRVLQGKQPILYGDGLQTREWLSVDDHVRGAYLALTQGTPGEVYNLGSMVSMTNAMVIDLIIATLTDGDVEPIHIPDPRGGAHDSGYHTNFFKAISTLGWTPRCFTQDDVLDDMLSTINWYKDNRGWWEPKVNSEEFKKWMSSFYKDI